MPSLAGGSSSAGTRTPRAHQVYSAARQQRGGNRTARSQCSVPPPRPCPLDAESPFAPSKRYLEANGIECRLEGRYPFFVAHTDSCVRPRPSHRLQFPSPMSLCRLLPVPAGRWPFPTLSLNSLCRCLDPYPAMSSWCTRPFLPRRLRLHIWWNAFRTSHAPGMQLLAGEPIFEAAVIHSCSGPCTRSASRLHAPQDRTSISGGQALYTTQNSVGCLPRAVASLRTRFGQLVRLDSHQLEFSLVGCSSTIRLLRE